MPALPQEVQDSPTVRAIYAAYEKKHEGQRRYLGASSIGKPCDRALWYEFRWCGREVFSGRMLRLFQTGHLEEVRFAHNLRDIGCEVHLADPSGQQFEVVALGGHFRGHMDGCVMGVPDSPKTWHLLEMKTHNAKSFASLKNKGVAEAKPDHVAQMQVYMHLGQLERALYLAVNKDTDELYAERIKYDYAEASRIMGKARSIIEAKTPPERVADSPDSFSCKFCAHKERCHGPASDSPAAPIQITCRSCCHATPVIEEGSKAGLWRCEKHRKALSEQEQQAGCDDHLLIPPLVTIGLPVNSGSDPKGDWIEYKLNDSDVTFRNGRQVGQYGSRELATVPASAIASGLVGEVKRVLGGTIVEEEK